MDLNKEVPLLDELSLAAALDACRQAGAINAAPALGKHVTRLSIELSLRDSFLKAKGLEREYGQWATAQLSSREATCTKTE